MYYKKIGLIVIMLIVTMSIILIIRKKKSVIRNGITIGILQTASHPSLDEAREGFIETIQKKAGDSINFIIQNAQGSVSNAHSIAQRFHANNEIKAIYAIATPAAQAIATLEKEKPIIIAAVSDTSLLQNQSNICGISDMVDITKIVALIHDFIPEAKTIALLYNNAEANSIAQVDLLKKELKKVMIESLEVGVTQESDISTAVSLACRKADALLCPTDNMFASAMEMVASIALNHKKPLFACYNQAVIQGALAAHGVDYKNSGKQAGEIALAILMNNKKPHDFPIEKAQNSQLFVNQKTLATLGLTIPENLKKQITLL